MNNPDKMISLVLGDWSHDGHGLSQVINIMSSLDKDELFKAYKLGTKKLGVNFIDDVCADYEDYTLPKDVLDKLIALGLKIEDVIDTGSCPDFVMGAVRDAFENDESEGLSVSPEEFANIFLFIVKLGNDNFKFEIPKGEEDPIINIGGYGIFSR